MTDSMSFINAPWFWYVVGMALFIYIVFLLKELYFNTQRFIFKAIIAFISVFSLSMIALKPAFEKEIDISKMAIITKNHNEVTLDSLKKTHENLKINIYDTSKPILDNANLPTSIFVLGEGIAPFDLWQLDHINTTFLNNSKLSGITRLTYQQDYTTGEKAIISGLYSLPIKGHKLLLENPGGQAIDSVILNTTKNAQPFQLKANLNIKGQYTYAITEKDSLDKTIKSNPIPINISEQNALRILIINGFPTFETKYLKNFLAEMGHSIVVRSQITKGRFKYEYFNMTDRPQTTITKGNLEQFDLVIFDANSLLNLSSSQRLSLENAIKDDGLGLLIQPTSRLFRVSSNLIPFKFTSDRVSEIEFPSSQNVRISKHHYNFKSQSRLQSIHTIQNKTLSAYIHFGSGRIATTVLENTFELVLNGQQQPYKNLWADIITKVSKRKLKTIFWEQQHLFVFKNEPFNFKLRTSIEKPNVKSNFGYSIPIQQQIDISSTWQGTSYPKTSGWHKHIVTQDSIQGFHYFVNETTDWQSIQAYNTIKANTNYSKNSSPSSIIQTKQDPINPIWFYILLLLSFGYLWLEPKL